MGSLRAMGTLGSQTNAVVTPLRKAASYEQRKTNLGNQTFRSGRIIT